MLWAKPQQKEQQQVVPAALEAVRLGPRMQLFFYNLCSKAGMANYSVIPASSDTCNLAPTGVVYGIGEVKQVKAHDCCAACLKEPWCLSWAELGPGICSLKDNVLERPPLPPTPAPTPADFKGKPGNCGGTSWADKSACTKASEGALKAKENNISTVEDCKAFCKACANCNYISFSIGAHGNVHDHNDCSWYTHCNMENLVHTGAEYTSAQVKNLPWVCLDAVLCSLVLVPHCSSVGLPGEEPLEPSAYTEKW
jgi:hypothetical protein